MAAATAFPGSIVRDMRGTADQRAGMLPASDGEPCRDCDRAALDAFLNAALREGRLDGAVFDHDHLRFRDKTGERYAVTVRARSSFRCLFDTPILAGKGPAARPISVETLLARLSGGDAVFQARVLDSLAAIRRAPPAPALAERWNFAEGEQALKAGHSHHPNPRSRDGMSEADAARYAPELGGRFRLLWLRVDPEVVAAPPETLPLLERLAEADGAPPMDLPGARIPWHPWQAEQLRQHPTVAAQIAAGRLVPLGPGGGLWTATSSMRTLHNWSAPFMLKVSLNLRLTNSIRTLSGREVARGLQVSALLGSALGAELRAAFPSLRFLGEPGFATLRDDAGGMLADAIVVLRDNPFRDERQPGPVMLASLCEAPPAGPSPLGALIGRLAGGGDTETIACRWFAQFLDVAILPLLEIRARYGLLFGAHQQNLLLDLERGWPAQAWVRDAQGTGHIADFHDRLTEACPSLGEGTENVVTAALGDELASYYIVVNSVLNTLATLVLDGLAAEGALLGLWRERLERARAATPGDPRLYDRLLTAPTLTCKANFATSLSGVNEADGGAEGQLATFLTIPNP